MRGKVGGRICLLLVGVFLIIGLIKEFDYQKSMIKALEFVNAKNEYLNDSSFEMALWNTTKENKNILIKWWYNKSEDKYYFFVPYRMAENGMHWMFSSKYIVWINDNKLDDGSVYDLDEGIYHVRVEQEQKIENYNMEIRYSSNVSSLFLETESGSINKLHESKDNCESGSYTLFEGMGDMYYTGEIENIHCRGNASWEETDKKSYQIKLAENTDLLGMGKDKQWLLLANAFDNTLLRNTIAFDMAKELGLSYTPDSRYADVYANGEYIGNYLVTEKIEIDSNRVDISSIEEQMELLNADKPLEQNEFFMEQQGRLFSTKGYRIEQQPEDISSGYLLEIEMSDRYGLEASGFITSRMQPVVFNSPKYASYEQVSYVANKYQDFEDAIFSEDGYSPYTGVYFADYIDMDSFARKYLLEELTKNLDAAFTSQFFYIPGSSNSTKFFAGPAWDYDKSIAASGITDKGIDLHDPNGLYAATQTKDSDIWYALYNQKGFREYAIKIYQEEFLDKARDITDFRIETYADYIQDSVMNNAIRWQVFPEQITMEEKIKQYDEKVMEIKDFLDKRLNFLNEEWSVQG